MLVAGCSDSGSSDSSASTESSASTVSQPSISSSSSHSSSSEAHLKGPQLLQSKGCVACHGDNGLDPNQPIVFANFNLHSLAAKITEDMPPGDPTTCDEQCAISIAEHLMALNPQPECEDITPLPRRLRLLTKFEYINTINDLFGRTSSRLVASTVGSDTRVHGFDNNVRANSVTIGRMDGFWTSAAAVAKSVSVTARLRSCSAEQTAECFVANFGRDAFRRPLTDQELADYVNLFKLANSDSQGARFVIQAMLIAPSFLYRTELGDAGVLTPYEVASLLSYTFWGTMPDESLFEKARNNQLQTIAELRSTVDEMLSNDKALNQFTHFGRQWLNVEPIVSLARDGFQFPKFTFPLKLALDEELNLFLQELLLTDGYTMADFFMNDFVFANEILADFYGLPPITGTGLQKVAANNQRGGLLFTGAVLARNAKFFESNPIQRGLLVRHQLLCQEFSPPPPNVGLVAPFDHTLPTRERYAAHSENEACANCHQYIDEIGFAFEHYDAVGQYRTTTIDGEAVDASGSITGLATMTDSDSHLFTDLSGLSSVLATEGFNATSACVATQFQRMMDGVEKPDSCTITNTVARWNPNEHSLRDLWIEMVASQAYRQRQ